MKLIPWLEAEPFRVQHSRLPDTTYGDPFGVFYVPGKALKIIAASARDDGTPFSDWEHVSVSLTHRCPTWAEMCFVKDLFWQPEEVVVQFHPRASEYRNHHPYCLHLWRHPTEPFPMPNPLTVAPA